MGRTTFLSIHVYAATPVVRSSLSQQIFIIEYDSKAEGDATRNFVMKPV